MKIGLLTMPFLLPQFPSLGLTQIKGRLNELYGDDVDVDIVYLNHDFFQYFGGQLYGKINNDATYTLLNDWVFRNEAFDNVTPNHQEYFTRFYPRQQFGADAVQKLMELGGYIRELIATYKLADYDVIGVNNTFSTVPGLAFCRHLKQIKPTITTVMGGAALYKDMGAAIAKYHPHVDYVCSGTGLISFPQLVGGLLDGDEAARESIDGIFTKKNAGKVGYVSDILDINAPIRLDYHDYFASLKKFGMEKAGKAGIFMETARGCYWGKCRFCGLNEDQLKYRSKKPEVAIEEIHAHFDEYDCDIRMVDNIMPRNYIKRVLPFLKVPEGKQISYEVRGDYTDAEMEALDKYGVREIQPGIESLVTSIHDCMNKGVTALQCIRMLKLCIKYGIVPVWNIIVGFPKMTPQMYQQLAKVLPLLLHLTPPGVLTPVRFDRYSTYWREKAEYQLDLTPFAAYGFIYPYDNNFLENIAYYFEDKNFVSPRVQLLSQFYVKVDAAFKKWQQRWKNVKESTFPRLGLHYKDDVPYVYDTRYGSLKEYRLTPLEDQILAFLDDPANLDAVKEKFTDHPEADIMKSLTRLERDGLMLKEEKGYLSLIIRDYRDVSIAHVIENLPS